jgi:hypothetical protein
MIGGIEETSASSKPGPRLDPTRLRGACSNGRPYRDPEILLAGVGQKTLPARVDGFELREVLHQKPELGAVSAHQGQAVDQSVEAAELAEFVEKERDAVCWPTRDRGHRIECQADKAAGQTPRTRAAGLAGSRDRPSSAGASDPAARSGYGKGQHTGADRRAKRCGAGRSRAPNRGPVPRQCHGAETMSRRRCAADAPNLS